MTSISNKKTKKKLIKWIIIGLIVLIAVWLIYKRLTLEESSPNYITDTAHIGNIENNVMASGKVKALNTVDVGAQVSGEVTKLYVKVGDNVKKNDLIAQIDQVTQKNNLSNQQASLEQSRAGVQSAKAEYMSRQASLDSAKADLFSRQVQLKEAESKLRRLHDLIELNAISQQEYESAMAQVDTAKAAVANAQANINSAQAGLVTAQSNIVRNQADLQKAQTNLATANEDLGYTTIRAPIEGTVVSITTEQGATVNALQTAPTIVTLADLSTVRINAQISEADVINVEAGMPVYFNTIGAPDQKYDAVLTAIEPAPEQISSTSSTNSAVYYVGYVEVPNPDRRFRIDMTAQVFIVIDRAKNALLVPSASLHKGLPPTETNLKSNTALKNTPDSEQNKNVVPQSGAMSNANNVRNTHYVKVLQDDGTVDNKVVTVGIDNRVNAQILSGLEAGDEVIISEETGAQSKDSGRPRGP